MNIPKKYTKGLSSKDKKKQRDNIKKAKKSYKNKKYIDRPKLKSYKNKKSSWTQKFKKKYGDITKISDISKKTGLPEGELRAVLRKGRGAYYSSGSRPNQTAESWGRARMYSYIMGGPTRKYDKEITEKYKKRRKKTMKGGYNWWNRNPRTIKADTYDVQYTNVPWKKKLYSKLNKDKNTPNMINKIKEDEMYEKINKKAQMRFKELENDLEKEDDLLFNTPINYLSPDSLYGSPELNLLDDIETDKITPRQIEYHTPTTTTPPIKQTPNNDLNLINIKYKYPDIIKRPIDISIKFNNKFCKFIAKKPEICDYIDSSYNIHFRYDTLSIYIYKVTNKNGIDIRDISLISTPLKLYYSTFYIDNALKKFYEELNIWFFNHKNGSLIMPIDYDIIEQNQMYISDNKKELILEFYSNIPITIILDFNDILININKDNILQTNMLPKTTILKCDIKNSNKDCNKSNCNACINI